MSGEPPQPPASKWWFQIISVLKPGYFQLAAVLLAFGCFAALKLDAGNYVAALLIAFMFLVIVLATLLSQYLEWRARDEEGGREELVKILQELREENRALRQKAKPPKPDPPKLEPPKPDLPID